MTARAELELPKTAPGGLPILGHLVPLVRDPHTFFKSLPRYGDLVRVRIGPVNVIVVCDPEMTHQVMRDDTTFDKGGVFFERGREALGNGLGTCLHRLHRRQRRLCQPAFHPTRLPGYASHMIDQIREVTGQWQDGKVVDVLVEMQTITMKTLAATLFSDSLPASDIRTAIDDIHAMVDGVFRRMLMPTFMTRLPTPGNRRFIRAHDRFYQTVNRVVTDCCDSESEQGDLLRALLASRDTESDGARRILSDEEISDNVVTFFLAGSDSAAGALSWALHLLALHPDVEDRLHAEVDAVLAGRAVTYADLPRLAMTGRVIFESLRLWPPGWLFTRQATADVRLGGHELPAGTTVIYSPYIIHHRADLYEDPERFDPDRWDSAKCLPPPRKAFIPFGGGARKCIGDAFGLAEATLALTAIVARWRLELVPGTQVCPARAAMMTPRGLRMALRAR